MEIVRICKVHGRLTFDQCGLKNKKPYYCKFCLKAYRSTPEYKKAKALAAKKYREKDPERYQRINTKHRRKYKERVNDLNKAIIRRHREELGDHYIKKLISQNLGIKCGEISKELIECKREIVKLKRAIKEKKNGKT